jgi:hypothetical protein
LNGNISFENHHLSPIVASNQTPSSTTNTNRAEWFVCSSGGRINIREHKHIVLNARNTGAGDAFLSLDTKPPVNEVHQYTQSTSLGQGKYKEERDKAASNADFFILFTTESGLDRIDLPKNCGIVCGDNWKEYFGPFAGRASLYRNAIVDEVRDESAYKDFQKRSSFSIEDAEEKMETKKRRKEKGL